MDSRSSQVLVGTPARWWQAHPLRPLAGGDGEGGQTPPNPPNPPNPPQPTPPTPPAPQPDPPAADDDAHDPARARRTIETLRQKEKEGAQAKRERDELAAKLKAFEDAQKTAEQRLADENADLKAKLAQADQRARDLTLRGAVETAARKLGAADASIVYRLVDVADLKADDDKLAAETEKRVQALLEAHPYLKGGTAPPAPQAPGRTPQGAGATLEQRSQAYYEQFKPALIRQ